MKTKLTQVAIVLLAFLFTLQESKAQQQLIHFWDFNQTYPSGGAGDSLGTPYAYANSGATSWGNSQVTSAADAAKKTSTLFANYSRLPFSATYANDARILFLRPTAKQTVPYAATARDSMIDNGATTGSFIYDYSAYNYVYNNTSDSASSNMFVRTRNPVENAYMYIYAPTTGFNNVNFNFALTASSASGAQYLLFNYSTDGGTTWKNLTTAMDTFNIGGVKRPDTLLATNPTTIVSAWYPVQMNFTSDISVNNNPNFIIRVGFGGNNSAKGSGNNRFDNFAILGDSNTSNIVSYFVNRTNIPKCYGDSTGSATVITKGGLTPYTYSWSNNVNVTATGKTSATCTGLSAGTYTVTVTDFNDIASTAVVTILQPTKVIPTLSTQTNVLCYGNTTGSAKAVGAGGTGPYTYSWSSGGGTSQTVSNLGQGAYTCTVTDKLGCPGTVIANITQPATAITATVTTSPVTCSTFGSANTIVSGGTPYKIGNSYVYHWSNGAATASIGGLGTGIVSDTIKDSNKCLVIATGTVTTSGAIINLTPTDITCNGSSNGAITSSVSGGTTPYTYSWSNSATTTSVSGLAPGGYTLTITEGNSCVSSASTVISQPNVLNDTVESVTPLVKLIHYWDFNSTQPIGGAGGDSLGNIANPLIPEFTTLSSANPHMIYSHPISGGITDNVGGPPYAFINDLHAAGNDTNSQSTNNVGVRTRNPVQNSSFVWYIPTTGYQNIMLDWALSASSSKGAQYLVFHYSTDGGTSWNKLTSVMDTFNTGGKIHPDSVNAINPTTSASNWYPVHIDLSSVAAANNNPNLVFMINYAGSNVTNTSGNNRFDNISVKGSEIPRVTCNGSNNGSGIVVASGGTTPYAFSWSTGETTATVTDLPPGTSSVTVTDKNGCSMMATVNVINPPVLTNSLVVNNGCNNSNNGTITSVPSGGTGPYSWSWSNTSAGSMVSGLTPGSYSVTVTDIHGCIATSSVTLTNPALLTVTPAPTNITCNGLNNGQAVANVSGGTTGYTYKWYTTPSQTTQTATGLIPGLDSVKVTDADGCIAKGFYTITQPGQFRDSISSSSNALCNGASGNATVGTKGGTTPYAYSWSDGNTNATDNSLTAGTYTVTVNDVNLCGLLTSTVTITEPTAIRDSISTSINVICYGGMGNATAGIKGGVSPYSYSWSDGNSQTTATATNLTAGTYTVTMSDANLCGPVTSTVTITQPAQLRDSISSFGNVLCNGGTGNATAAIKGGVSPYTYAWSNGASTASVSSVAAGTYTVSINDANLCGPLTSTVTITQPAQLRDSVTAVDITEGCVGQNDGSASVSIKGGTTAYSYSWNTTPVQTASIASNLGAGNYTVVVTDANNCVASANFTIRPDSVPVINFNLAADSVQCDTVKAVSLISTATPAGGSFSGPGVSANNFHPKSLGVGKYLITYTYSNKYGCQSSATQAMIVKSCVFTGIAQSAVADNIVVFPNPTTGQVSINGLTIGTTLELYNDIGMLVKTTTVNSETMLLNIADLSNGVYMMRVIYKDGASVIQKKIIKLQ